MWATEHLWVPPVVKALNRAGSSLSPVPADCPSPSAGERESRRRRGHGCLRMSSPTSINDDMVLEQVLMKSDDRSEVFRSQGGGNNEDQTSGDIPAVSQKEWQRKLASFGRNFAETITALKTYLTLDSMSNRISSSESRRHVCGSIVDDLAQIYPGNQLPEKLVGSVRKHYDSLPLCYAQAQFSAKEVLDHMRLIEEAAGEDRPAVFVEVLVAGDGDEVPGNTTHREKSVFFRLTFACNSSVSWPAVSCVLDDPAFFCKKMQIFEKKSLTLGVVTVAVSAEQEGAFKSRIETAFRSSSRRPKQGAMRLALGLCGCQEENIRNPTETTDGAGDETICREFTARLSDQSPLMASQTGASSFFLSVDEWQDLRSGGNQLGKWLLNSDQVDFGDRLGSKVFKGVHRGKKVAITKLPGCERVDSFNVELRRDLLDLMTRGHKNVLPFYGVLLHQVHGMCTVTKFMDGGSIDRLIRFGRKKLQYRQIVNMATDVVEGMTFMIDNGVVYRDLNAQRVLLDRQGNACLGDMGVVTPCKQGVEILEYETAGYRWLAPEIIAGDPESVVETEESNVYSFGMILWEMVTGELAYESCSPVQAAVGIAACGLRPEIPADCPSVLRSLMQRCWNSNPSKRPHFCDLLVALRAAASVLPPR